MNGASSTGALLERLQHQHHDLNCQLLHIKSELSELAGSRDRALYRGSIERHLQVLSAQLKRHFGLEEEEGCFDEPVSRCASLAREARTLKSEHEQISGMLDRLIERMHDEDCSLDRANDEFDGVAANLKAHEARESKLLQMALGGDASEYDVEGNE